MYTEGNLSSLEIGGGGGGGEGYKWKVNTCKWYDFNKTVTKLFTIFKTVFFQIWILQATLTKEDLKKSF